MTVTLHRLEIRACTSCQYESFFFNFAAAIDTKWDYETNDHSSLGNHRGPGVCHLAGFGREVSYADEQQVTLSLPDAPLQRRKEFQNTELTAAPKWLKTPQQSLQIAVLVTTENNNSVYISIC